MFAHEGAAAAGTHFTAQLKPGVVACRTEGFPCDDNKRVQSMRRIGMDDQTQQNAGRRRGNRTPVKTAASNPTSKNERPRDEQKDKRDRIAPGIDESKQE